MGFGRKSEMFHSLAIAAKGELRQQADTIETVYRKLSTKAVAGLYPNKDKNVRDSYFPCPDRLGLGHLPHRRQGSPPAE